MYFLTSSSDSGCVPYRLFAIPNIDATPRTLLLSEIPRIAPFTFSSSHDQNDEQKVSCSFSQIIQILTSSYTCFQASGHDSTSELPYNRENLRIRIPYRSRNLLIDGDSSRLT
jgi:hypothetical protein